MISLDSPHWSDITHAYGMATDIPLLLKGIEKDPSPPADARRRSNTWFHLWSSLYHQGDIYPASLAAVPHLIQIGLRAVEHGPISGDFLMLPACVEIAHAIGGRSAVAGEPITHSFHVAIKRLPDLVHACRAYHPWSEPFTRAACAAQSAAAGQHRFAEAILKLDEPAMRRLLK
ncbi:MAG: hypothetical protein ACAI35_20340 [Candidatus Methylacidiphilales bacterium]|nr:hypothetical protein [Candidatus Methylacidiphilales bacterium]